MGRSRNHALLHPLLREALAEPGPAKQHGAPVPEQRGYLELSEFVNDLLRTELDIIETVG